MKGAVLPSEASAGSAPIHMLGMLGMLGMLAMLLGMRVYRHRRVHNVCI